MRRIIFFASLPLVLFALYFSLKDHPCHLKTKHNAAQIQLSNNASLEEGMRLLRSRYDDAALL
ncbi:MAG: hypothetical protein JW788_03900, partial [Candidatus Omnitrophica bacterium]|nr:hypothetical protein [Candidatus Omnitrophota bacterium]